MKPINLADSDQDRYKHFSWISDPEPENWLRSQTFVNFCWATATGEHCKGIKYVVWM